MFQNVKETKDFLEGLNKKEKGAIELIEFVGNIIIIISLHVSGITSFVWFQTQQQNKRTKKMSLSLFSLAIRRGAKTTF